MCRPKTWSVSGTRSDIVPERRAISSFTRDALHSTMTELARQNLTARQGAALAREGRSAYPATQSHALRRSSRSICCTRPARRRVKSAEEATCVSMGSLRP